MRFEGRIRFHLFPGNIDGEELRREVCKMSLADKERHGLVVADFSNLLSTLGRNQLLNDIGNNGSVSQFAQYLGIGSNPIVQCFPGDTSIPGEFYRMANNGYSINGTGTSVNIDFFANTSQANASIYTSIGILGNGAVSTPGGAGQLNTHALVLPYGFSKTSANSLDIHYLIGIV